MASLASTRLMARDIEVEPLSECITIHIHSNLCAPRRFYTTSSRKRRSHSSGTVGAAGRPIANRPDPEGTPANLPHIASAVCLRRYRIVAAREDWNEL
jgi:hypothetical protein